MNAFDSLFFLDTGSITDRRFSNERQQLRESIGKVMGVTPKAIESLSNRVKDDLPLELLSNK